MNVVRVKDGVEFTTISPAGFRLLGAIDKTATLLGLDLMITSACDGAHSGADDPHHLGEAYDVRSRDVADKDLLLRTVLSQLGTPIPASGGGGGYVTAYFFGWLEDAGRENEHFHFQRRRGMTYPPILGTSNPEVTT